MEEAHISVHPYKNREIQMEDAVYLIVVSCLVLLLIIYLLIAIIQLNKDLIKAENDFSFQKDRLLTNYKEQLKNNKSKEKKQKYINKKVIGICPKRENPIIGICVNFQYDYTKSKEYPLIRDYVTNEDVVFDGKLIIYSEILFNALYKLNNEDRIAVLEINEDPLSLLDGYSKRLTKYEIKEILEKNNFYN